MPVSSNKNKLEIIKPFQGLQNLTLYPCSLKNLNSFLMFVHVLEQRKVEDVEENLKPLSICCLRIADDWDLK